MMSSIQDQIELLKQEIQTVDAQINKESEALIVNEIQIYRLRKRNKAIKEQIQKLESLLKPDIIA